MRLTPGPDGDGELSVSPSVSNFHTHAHVHEIVNKKSTNTLFIYLFVEMDKMIVFVTSDIKIEQKHIFQSSGFAQQRHHHWAS